MEQTRLITLGRGVGRVWEFNSFQGERGRGKISRRQQSMQGGTIKDWLPVREGVGSLAILQSLGIISWHKILTPPAITNDRFLAGFRNADPEGSLC